LQIQETMLKYDFEIMYQKGSEMPADFLSWNVISQIFETKVNSMRIKNHQLELEQDQEPWIKEIKEWLLTGSECKTTTTIS
jgi:hypothetical protein